MLVQKNCGLLSEPAALSQTNGLSLMDQGTKVKEPCLPVVVAVPVEK